VMRNENYAAMFVWVKWCPGADLKSPCNINRVGNGGTRAKGSASAVFVAGKSHQKQRLTMRLRLALLPDARAADGEPRVALIGLADRPTIFATIGDALAAKRAAEAVAHG